MLKNNLFRGNLRRYKWVNGKSDLIAVGNNTHTRLRAGNISANHGQVFINDRKSGFPHVHQNQTGLNVRGEIRALQEVNGALLVKKWLKEYGSLNLPRVIFYG